MKMNKIEVKILNPEAVAEAEKMMVCAARLTQSGHKVKSAADFMELYEKPFTRNTVAGMVKLPHPTIQKLGVINVVIVGASRRFLAQITRHQNEVKFMSASLQYSDYSHNAAFAVPYNILAKGEGELELYLDTCKEEMRQYESAIEYGVDHDSAGYMMPQGLRNVLIVSATPYQWKHMISQRTCRRNTDETRIVLLKVWQQLMELSPDFFSVETTGPFCCRGGCQEGKMSCGKPLYATPGELLRIDYPALFREDKEC